MPSAIRIIPQVGAEVTPSGPLARSIGRRGLPALGLPTPGLRGAVIPGRTCASRPAPGPVARGGCPSADFTGTPSFSRVQAAPLGTYAKSPSRNIPYTSEQADIALVRRFQLQAGARSLLPLERVSYCLRCRQAGKDVVDVWHLPALGRARLGGLQTCGSVWMCPICAAKVSERRKQELTAALVKAEELGLFVLFVTYTARHYIGDDLGALVDGMMKARSRASSGRQAKENRERWGVVGHVRALEVTHGENGWHPHVHELLFLRSDDHIAQVWKDLSAQWVNALRLAGMRDVNEHGIDVKFADTEIADYIAKYGHERTWNVEHELTKQPVKRGRGQGSRTPVELLAGYALDGDLDAGALWRQYAVAMKGRRQLAWSRGLRAVLLPGEVEKSDHDLAEETDQVGVLLAQLSGPEWARVLYLDVRAQLMSVAASGDAGALRAWLDGLRARVSDPESRRIAHSMVVKSSRFDDLKNRDLAQEAADLGLSVTEWLAYRRGGVNAIATEGRAAGPTEEERRLALRRKGVKQCGESEQVQRLDLKLL